MTEKIDTKAAVSSANSQPAQLIAPDAITIHDSVSAHVHFDGSQAYYHNTVGMYVYDAQGNVTSTQILFADASYRGLVGSPGDFNIKLREGEHIGFFVAPNAAEQGNTLALMQAGGTFHMVNAMNGAPANVNAGQPMQLAYHATDGSWSNVHTQFWTALFTTNTADNIDGLQHSHVSVDTQTGQMHVAFEDMMGGGTLDFADASFTIDLGRDNAKYLAKVAGVGDSGSPKSAAQSHAEAVSGLLAFHDYDRGGAFLAPASTSPLMTSLGLADVGRDDCPRAHAEW
jgi:hypothetical protein